MENKGSQIINCLALSISILIFSMFSGFYLSERTLILNQNLQFPEYLACNIEKSELIISDSQFLRLKKVTRPSLNEIQSLLTHEISATVQLNYAPMFQNSVLTIHSKAINNFTPVFLNTYDFDEHQSALLVQSASNLSESGVYINQSMFNLIKESINFFDWKELTLSFLGDFDLHGISYTLDLQFHLAGVFNELSYLTCPKIYFSQNYLSEVFSQEQFDNGQSVNDYLYDLTPSEPLTGYSYRLYFLSLSDLERCQNIIKSLENEQQHLQLSGENLTRVSSLTELLNFTNIVILISLTFVVVSLVFINVSITNTELKKANRKNALIFFFGARFVDLVDVALEQNFLIVSLSMVSLIFVPLITNQFNAFLNTVLGIDLVITVPLVQYNGVYFLLPFLIFTLTYLFSSCTSLLILLIRNQKSLVKRLAYND